jgi:glycosyltransferase involved in cell wall biosynthesis
VADLGSGSRPRVLHVACNLGSGVAAAIASYASVTPEFDHRLLCDVDPECAVDELTAAVDEVIQLAPGRRGRVAQIRDVVRRLDPAVIHAHSSYAGGYVRLAVRDRRRIVHTPHCYAFYRRDLGRPARGVLWLAEAALSYRGSIVAACSPLEYDAARALPARRTVVYVPNAAPTPLRSAPARLSSAPEPRRDPTAPGLEQPGPARVVASGRLCAQKAPDVFAAAAELSRCRGLDLRWQWVGGGQQAFAAKLESAGVEVTGWLPRDSARLLVERADVYVHSAAWESAPLTVLEAVGAEVPVLARDHSAMRRLGLRPLWASVEALVDILATYPSGPAFVEAATAGRRIAAAHQLSAQRAALLEVYARAAGAGEPYRAERSVPAISRS